MTGSIQPAELILPALRSAVDTSLPIMSLSSWHGASFPYGLRPDPDLNPSARLCRGVVLALTVDLSFRQLSSRVQVYRVRLGADMRLCNGFMHGSMAFGHALDYGTHGYNVIRASNVDRQ